MPYYDQYSGMEVETPEEEAARKKREAELANQQVGETKIKQYADGSQTETITKEIPSPAQGVSTPTIFDNLGSALAAMPTNFANNLNRGVENLQQAPANFARNVQAIPGQVQQRVQQAQQAVAPVTPDQAAYTRQQESSGNYNIGYHYKPDAQGQRQSSAFGPYGFTAASVQDIARQDPALNKPIEQWNKQEHDRAYAIKTQQNGTRLGQLGVEATPGALQVAHLLGADGAARFLKTGEVSEAAAKANGGAERLKQIAQGRFAGNQAPASGAAQAQQPQQAQPAPTAPVAPGAMPAVNYSLATGQSGLGLQAPAAAPAPAPNPTEQAIGRYQAIQNDPNELMKFAFDSNTPAYLQQRAKDQLVESYDRQKKEVEANKALASLTPNDVARAMTRKSEGNSVGDWVQYLLFKHVGLNDLANQKGEQLGIGHTWARSNIVDRDGNDVAVEIQTTSSGKLLGGNRLDGTPLTQAELNQTGGTLGKGASLSAEVYVDPTTGNRYRSGYDSAGRAALVNIQGGAAFRGDPRNLTLQSVGTAQAKADIGLITDLKKKHGTNVLDAEKDYVALNGPFKSPADRAQFRQAYGFELAQPAGTTVQGGQVVQGAPAAAPGGAVAPTPVTAGAAAAPSNINVPLAEQQQSLEAQKKIKESQAKNSYQARQLAPYVAQIKDLIPKTTSSGVGAGVDAAGRVFGLSNEGADAIAAMAPLADKILKTVERFEGPQSDIDVQSYKDASGKLSDPTIPVRQKQAAFNTVIDILKRQAPDVNWTEALMTREDKAAMKWANANPDDPRAKQIKKRFEQ